MALVLFHKHNIHLLHWNLKGDKFLSFHQYFGELYDEMESQIDTITEMYIQEGGTPITYKEMLDLLNADDTDHAYTKSDTLYTMEEAITLAIQIFNEIIDAIDACYDEDSIPRAHKSELETIQGWYMLRAKYLMRRLGE